MERTGGDRRGLAGTARGRRTRRWVVAAAGLLATACGGSAPTAPAPVGSGPGGVSSALRVTPGAHVLLVTGNALGGACTGLPAGTATVAGMATLAVEAEGTGWVARAATPASGDIVLRLRPSGIDTPLATGVTGSASGTVAGVPLGASAEVRVVFEQGALLAGEQLRGSTAIVGEAQGSVRFSDGTGVLAVCSRVAWSLGPSGSGQ